MVQSIYKPIPKSDGVLEVQSIPYVFHNVTNIVEKAVVGDKYYDPNTGKMSSLIGQTEYDNVTATALLSKTQFEGLNRVYTSPKARDGSLTATHKIGDITTILTGVRILSRTYGEFDKTSNSAAEIQIELSFTGLRNS